MPTDEWRDSGRLSAAGVFARPHLRKVLVRNISISSANSSSNSSSSTPDTPLPVSNDVSTARKSVDEKSASAADEEAAAAAAVQKRRQSQFLDRWAARQAKEMVTTIERQAYEAELSALATRTQPVSARAMTFLRETSPAPSESSISAARTHAASSRRAPSPALSECSFVSAPATLPCSVSGGGNSIGTELAPNVRASSLIQMWRELEAEAGVSSIVRTTSCGSGGCGDNLEPNNPAAFPDDQDSPGSSDNSDEQEPFADLETEITMRRIDPASTEPAAMDSSLNESETSKVGNIVKLLNSGYESTSSTGPSPSMDEKERALPRRKKAVLTDSRDCEGSSALSGMTLRRVRGSKELEELVMRREQERRREIEKLAEGQHVSRFCYRGRLQSTLRLRSLRRQFAVREQMRASTSVIDNNRSSNWSTFTLFRQKFELAAESSDSSKREAESSSSLPVSTHQPSHYLQSVDEFAGESTQFMDILPSPRGSKRPINEVMSSQVLDSSDGSWDERSMWVSNLDWQRNIESSPSNGWQGDMVIEESDSCSELNARINTSHTCIGEYPNNSWRGWDAVSRRSSFHESARNFSDNVEIRELLERRVVNTTLASDFSDKMNRIISGFVRRQGSGNLDENYSDNNEDQSVWRRMSELDDFEQIEPVSSSLVPFGYHTNFHQNGRWLPNFLTDQPSHNLSARDVMHDLRNEMQQVRQEISELRSMVQSCMQWQEKFQQSIKQDILDAIRQAGCLIIPNGNGVDRSMHSSNTTPGRKGSCCICYEMKVDSLLYRCGHMCTCFKCACELQWSSGRCPICRSPIVDVVRAYPNT